MKMIAVLLLAALAASAQASGKSSVSNPGRHMLAVGDAYTNPISLGSDASIFYSGNSVGFPDTKLGGCNEPANYGNGDGTATTGDGGDMFFKWTAPYGGDVTVYACSETFGASLSVYGNGTDAVGDPVVDGQLGCGGVFEGCSDPLLKDPDSQLLLEVTAGQTLILLVSGTEANDAGDFKLSLELNRPGYSVAAATFLDGTEGPVTVTATTASYASSYNSTCNAADDGASVDDGPDRYYSFSTSTDGLLTAQACADGFDATITIFSEAAVAGGKETPLACGTCAKPPRVMVAKDKFFYIAVSGSKAGDAGEFELTVSNTEIPAVGVNMTTPIDLGSAPKVTHEADSGLFPDSVLGGCNEPANYGDGSGNATKGDGGDMFFKWTAPFTGDLTAYACSDVFPASLTAYGNGTDADGLPIVMGNLGCGGVFEGCSDPLLQDPDSQLLLEVTKGQTIILGVSGTGAMDYGAFSLVLNLALPGSSVAAATYLDGSSGPVTVAATTATYPSTYNSTCNAGQDGASVNDGADRYFSYGTTSAGLLTARACAPGFNATITIFSEAAVAGGKETPLACGTCAKPPRVSVAADKFFYIVVSGSKARDAGPFSLTVTNTAAPTVGVSMTTPIDLGSAPKVVRNADSGLFPDSVLGGCNEPANYGDGSGNATKGDGGDMFFKWTAPYAGDLTAYVCSNTFPASLTVYGNGTDADGTAIVMGNLGCGGVFESCIDPLLRDPDSQLILEVTKGQTLILGVTGTDANDFGAFRLVLDLALPGSSVAAATYLGDRPSVAVQGTTVAYPVTHNSQCNANRADGPDRYYGYTAATTGLMTVKACGAAGFNATVTIFSEALLGGKPIPLACGTCAFPARITTTNGTFYYIAVTGNGRASSGAFRLTVGMSRGLTAGATPATAIVLGSPSKLVRPSDTSRFVDSQLGGCNEPANYNNKTVGDGGDMFFKWTAPFAGFLTASACSDRFGASLTVIGDGVDANGKPFKNDKIGCGGVFRNCADPNLRDPDSQLILEVKKGQVLTLGVTGTEAGDYGAFKLNLDLALPGSSLAVANYLGDRPNMSVSGTTKGYPSTFNSNCNARKPDGPDQYYSYTAPINGTLTAKACTAPNGYKSTVTIMAEALSGGRATPLACGTCAKPATTTVTAGQFVYIVVTGSKATDAGPFVLSVATKAPTKAG